MTNYSKMDARKRSPINCTPVLTNYFSLGTCFYQGSTVTKIIPQCSLQMEGGSLGTVSRNFHCGKPALERLEYHCYGSKILDPPPPLDPSPSHHGRHLSQRLNQWRKNKKIGWDYGTVQNCKKTAATAAMTLLQNNSMNLKTARECELNRYPKYTNYQRYTLLMSSNYRKKYTVPLPWEYPV